VNRPRAGALLALLGALGGIVRADTVVLSNGARMQGTIEEESETAVVLRTAEGRVRLNRARVQSIERDAAGATAVASPRTPAAPVFAELDQLDKRRREAARTEAALLTAAKTREARRLRMQALDRSLTEKAGRLAALEQRLQESREKAGPEAARQAQELARQFQALIDQGQPERDEFLRLRRADQDDSLDGGRAMRAMTDYAAALEALLTALPEHRQALRGTADLARLEDRLRRHVREPALTLVPLQRGREAHVVEAAVAGQTLRLELQPGQSHLVLDPATFARLGLRAQGNKVSVRLHDGTQVECASARLDGLALGALRLDGLTVAMSPDEIEGFDGLFGLGVLSESLFRVDDAKGRLVVMGIQPLER
jgi:hypothetical protein